MAIYTVQNNAREHADVEAAIKSAKRCAKKRNALVLINRHTERYDDSGLVAYVWPSGQVDLTWLGSCYA